MPSHVTCDGYEPVHLDCLHLKASWHLFGILDIREFKFTLYFRYYKVLDLIFTCQTFHFYSLPCISSLIYLNYLILQHKENNSYNSWKQEFENEERGVELNI